MRISANVWVLVGLAAILATSPSRASGLASDPEQTDEWKAPARAARKQSPIPADEASLALGKKLYSANCASCHGTAGRGDGPAIKDLEKKPGDLTKLDAETDGSLFWKITEGRKPMPSYDKLLSEEQRWQVVVYVHSFGPSTPASVPQFAAPEASRQAISSILAAYSTVQAALAREDQAGARAATQVFATTTDALPKLEAGAVGDDLAKAWDVSRETLQQAAKALKDAPDLTALRAGFRIASDALIDLVAKFGHHEAAPVELFSCSKAFDGEGARWLQRSGDAANPYLAVKTPSPVKLDKTFAAEAPPKKRG